MDESDEDETEYELESFNIGPFSFEVITVSYLPITKLMQLQSSQSEISGQKLWCGSISMVEYLIGNPDLVNGKAVVELGAGTGVLGMACSKLGASTVFLTDHDEKSLNHMQADVVRNNVDACVVRLDWYHPDLEFFDYSNTTSLRIVAGDVLYKEELIQPFLQVAFTMLAVESSFLLLSHVPRHGVEHSMVLDMCTKLGLRVETIPSEQWKKGACLLYCPKEDNDRAALYKIYR